MRKLINSTIAFILAITAFLPAVAANAASHDLSGKFVFQKENTNDIWYISTDNKEKYYLTGPQDAFNLMRYQGHGISNSDLNMIPMPGEKHTNNHLGDSLKGKILLQVEDKGQAWYVHTDTGERHSLGRPQQAFDLFRSISIESNSDELNMYKQINSIAETASNAGIFNTLVTALDVAGLVGVLQNGGPFTVFAPTDDAFAKIPTETLESVLNDKETLTKILTYHVVSGKVSSADIMKINKAATLQGGEINIDTSNGVVIDSNSNVITADIKANNGIIHVIDTVLMP